MRFIEIPDMITNTWYNGDDILCYCPICRKNKPTFITNSKTKKYRCLNCGNSGKCDIITSKSNPDEIVAFYFIEIDKKGEM